MSQPWRLISTELVNLSAITSTSHSTTITTATYTPRSTFAVPYTHSDIVIAHKIVLTGCLRQLNALGVGGLTRLKSSCKVALIELARRRFDVQLEGWQTSKYTLLVLKET